MVCFLSRYNVDYYVELQIHVYTKLSFENEILPTNNIDTKFETYILIKIIKSSLGGGLGHNGCLMGLIWYFILWCVA